MLFVHLRLFCVTLFRLLFPTHRFLPMGNIDNNDNDDNNNDDNNNGIDKSNNNDDDNNSDNM